MTALTLDTLVKVTDGQGRAMHGGTGKWTKGRWRSVTPPLRSCSHGLHVVTIAQAPAWLGPRIGLVEVAGERIDEADKSVVERARVTGWLTTWGERSARLFAADCAEHVLPIFARGHPDDDRPRRAIETARAFARGNATRQERDAAWAAAWDAAGDAAGDAAWAAAGAAAGDAAGDAAWAAAGAAAGDAAGDAEVKWQADRLLVYLRGEA